MAMITGSAEGNILSQEEIYVEGAPYVYYQNNSGVDELNHPDGDGYYWNLSGTLTNPVYALGCYEDVRLSDNIEVNAVRCDTVGDVNVMQKRAHLELTFTLKSLFPLTSIQAIIRGHTVTTPADFEKMGIGNIDNAPTYYVYFPRVYDETAGDYICVTGHNCKFVDAWEMTMPFATPWTLGVTVWMMADDTMPSGQEFATMIRYDPSVL